MKLKALIALAIIILYCNFMQSQASTSNDFQFSFYLPKEHHSNRYKIVHATYNGHEINWIKAGMSAIDHTLVVRGHSSYVVGVPFPDVLIEEEVYSRGNFEKRNYYLVKFSSNGVENNDYPFIQLNPAYKKHLAEIGEVYQGRVEIQVSSCTHPYCGALYSSLTSLGKPWQSVNIEDLDDQYQRMITGPELPKFIIHGPNRPYSVKMELFTSTYQIDFDYQNVTVDEVTMEQTRAHNQQLAQRLDQLYGVTWRSEIDVAVFGL